MEIDRYLYYYFLGIGGIGMSALAKYLLFNKKQVFGYDRTPSDITLQLEKEGVKIIFDDDTNLIPGHLTPESTCVIFTPAIPNESSLRTYFAQKQFKMLKRAEFLGKIANSTKLLAVAGTHGKTTTSTLLAHIVYEAQLSASAFLGGVALNYHSNFFYNGNEFTITEADEFDRSFLYLQPSIAGITSIEADHLDIYGQHAELKKSFQTFANQCDKLFVKKGLSIEHHNKVSYAFDEHADCYGNNYRWEEPWVYLDYHGKKELKNLKWRIPGKYNAENAVLAISIALEIGIAEEVIYQALESFEGIHRRFNLYKTHCDKWVIDDYAHHPTEIRACLQTIRSLFPNKKLLTVFQPHLFTRTRDFMDDFARELSNTDELLLIDIYPARENPIEGITSEALAKRVQLPNVRVCGLQFALQAIEEYDAEIVALLGAGSIDSLVQPLIKKWNE